MPSFHGAVHELDARLRERMSGVSWQPGCPVALDDLRLLELTHWSLDGSVEQGKLIVHGDHAAAVVDAFAKLFEAEFPIAGMRLIDDFEGDDDASMAANNTSGFNGRRIASQPGGEWSQHASGLAIDINPLQNPYIPRPDVVLPPAAAAYLDRTADEPGMIHRQGPVVRAFADIGWHWGGDWSPVKDYHHFSANGR